MNESNVVSHQYSADGGKNWHHISADKVFDMSNDCRYQVRGLVTHADYRALEEDHAELRIAYDAEYKRSRELEQDLASLRARVGEFLESDASYDDHISHINDHSLKELQDAAGRRDNALEALK